MYEISDSPNGPWEPLWTWNPGELVFDPNLKAPETDQFTLGYEHQVGRNMSVGIQAVYKDTENLIPALASAQDESEGDSLSTLEVQVLSQTEYGIEHHAGSLRKLTLKGLGITDIPAPPDESAPVSLVPGRFVNL